MSTRFMTNLVTKQAAKPGFGVPSIKDAFKRYDRTPKRRGPKEDASV